MIDGMEVCAVPFEYKAVAGTDGESGHVEGYGAVFGNMDSHGDVILPGAFAKSISERKAQGRVLPMHIMHGVFGGDGVPAGVWNEMAEDSKGLHVKGKISGTNTDAGRLLYERVKDGALGGLSIGYSVPPGGSAKLTDPNGPRRQIKQANLFEVSLVDDPSNALARVTELKRQTGDSLLRSLKMSMGNPDSMSDFDKAMDKVMSDMMRSMSSASMTGDPDHDFLAMMIPHHQGAIAMAQAELQHGKNADTIALARNIISSQTQQVSQMRDMLSGQKCVPRDLPELKSATEGLMSALKGKKMPQRGSALVPPSLLDFRL